MKKIHKIITVVALVIFINFLFPSFIPIKAQSTSFSFTSVGDYGNNRDINSNFSKLLRGIGSQQPDFHLGLGDFIYSDTLSNIPLWCKHVKDNINLGAGKTIGDPYGENFPFELISGNHDAGEGNANIMTISNPLRDCLPHRISNITQGTQLNGSAYGLEYYFDYPNTTTPLARVILVSPDLWGWNYARNDVHYNFVKNAILSARDTLRPTGPIPWIIVGMHKNCVTNAVKTCEIGADMMNLLAGKDIGPGGVGYGQPVDLVLEGHEHTYHRSKHLKTNSTTCTGITINGYDQDCVTNHGPNNFQKGEGKIIAIVGTGGVGLRNITLDDPEENYFSAWTGANESVPPNGTGSYGFLKVTVNATEMKGQFIATTGSYSDIFSVSTSNLPTVTNTPAAPSPTSGTIHSADANNDGKVDLVDYRTWVENYVKSTTSGKMGGDFNSDGRVNTYDFGVLLQFFTNL